MKVIIFGATGGIGKYALKHALNKGYDVTVYVRNSKKINIDRVLLGTYEDNIGSWKTMEKCGAEFEKVVIEEDTGLPIKRYWISLKKRYANRAKMRNGVETEEKIKNVDTKEFKGDVYFIYFKKVLNPFILENRIMYSRR